MLYFYQEVSRTIWSSRSFVGNKLMFGSSVGALWCINNIWGGNWPPCPAVSDGPVSRWLWFCDVKFGFWLFSLRFDWFEANISNVDTVSILEWVVFCSMVSCLFKDGNIFRLTSPVSWHVDGGCCKSVGAMNGPPRPPTLGSGCALTLGVCDDIIFCLFNEPRKFSVLNNQEYTWF